MTNLAMTDYEEEYDEFDEDEINSPDYVDYYFRRKADWEKRVKSLFDLIEAWLPKGYFTTSGGFRETPDKMMLKFESETKHRFNTRLSIHYGDKSEPSYDKLKENEICSLKPAAQWVFGNNGVFHLVSHLNNFALLAIIDRAPKKKINFNKPQWVINHTGNWYQEKPLTREVFLKALEEMHHAKAA